jgi:hypothetical protein
MVRGSIPSSPFFKHTHALPVRCCAAPLQWPVWGNDPPSSFRKKNQTRSYRTAVTPPTSLASFSSYRHIQQQNTNGTGSTRGRFRWRFQIPPDGYSKSPLVPKSATKPGSSVTISQCHTSKASCKRQFEWANGCASVSKGSMIILHQSQ